MIGNNMVRAVHWLRWVVLAVWVCAVVVLIPVAGRLPGMVNDTPQANLPSNAESTRVAAIVDSATRGQPHTDSVTVVLVRDSGLSAADLRVVDAAHTAVELLTGHVEHLGTPGTVRRSADGSAVQFTADVAAPAPDLAEADAAVVRSVREAVTSLPATSGEGLRLAVTGSAALTVDGGIGNQNALLATSLAIVALILLLVYRSPVLWVLPVLGTLAALVVARAATYALAAAAGLTVTSLSTAIQTVLVLGASTDYALLLVHRYRQELRAHPTPAQALTVAVRRTLPAVVASAATVTAAMLCLLLAQSASLRGLGPVAAVAMVAVLLLQLTLLPALLLVAGRPAFWPLLPRFGGNGRDDSRVWQTIGHQVALRPRAVLVTSVVLLLAAGAGLAGLHVDDDPVAIVNGRSESVAGQQMLADHFPAGESGPLLMLSPPGLREAAVAAARSATNVATVTAGPAIGGYAAYTIVMSVPPYGPAGSAAVADVRGRLAAAAPGALVGGGPAVQADTAQAAGRDAMVLIPVVLIVVLVIIGVLVRAILAPLVLVLTTAISFAAAMGLASQLWHALGYPGVEAQLPLYVFVFLVALGVDYNIFLIARVREEAHRLGTHPGVMRGLTVTGGVITAAGLVLAATFGALSRLPYVPVAQVGSAIAIGVLLDTLLVRTIVVPAALLILGDSSWWPSRAAVTTGPGPSDRQPADSPPPTDQVTTTEM